MKRGDSGDFCMLYIEPEDDKSAVFALVGEQKKPVVILLSMPPGAQAKIRVFQRPEDFSDLKHLRRQRGLTVIFVITGNEYLRQLALRNGFPAYTSIDVLSDALEEGYLSLNRQRIITKSLPTAAPASQASSTQPTWNISAKKTVPLAPPSPRPDNTHTATPAPLPASQPPARRRRRGSRFALIMLILLSLIILGGAGYFLFYARASSPANAAVTPPKIMGQVNFLSSEQVSETSNQGLNDEIQLDLHGIQSPAPGNSYYAWLLSDENQGDTTVISLGKLTLNQGSAHLLYTGDQQHTNLLAIVSRFLVTEESSTTTPIAPSPDYATWRFYGEVPQTPTPQDANHYSYLDHLRHLLASDPLLNELELPGGLCNWFYRNTDKLLEWTESARDQWDAVRDTGFALRQTIRTLAYLDGLSFITQDLPPGTSIPTIPNLASVGLINVHGANQTPPGYIAHILLHLNGLINAPGSTLTIRQQAAQIIDAMSNVQQWLQKLHDDARQFVSMTNAQLLQPAAFALLNDMVQQANYAYSGQIDPVTGVMHEGVNWIHAQAQSLATLNVYQYVQSVQIPEVVPNTSPFTMLPALWKREF